MGRDEIINRLIDSRAELDRLGVKDIAVFGSVARIHIKPDSDVDVLVGWKSTSNLDLYMDLRFYREELLQRRIDLVTRSALKPRMRPKAKREAIRDS